jgi:N-acetylglucosamine kinase-like BadF-type ATPase
MGITLIADSGSTKTAWRGFAGTEIFLEIETGGLNPVYLSEDSISSEVEKNLKPFINFNNVERMYFYGAGCHSTEMQMKLQNALSLFFPESILHIHSDMEGAAIGLFGRIPGIACIMGTGSNSCFWNGKIIEKSIPALGYIIGDEGSGAWMGKRIAADYLRGFLPEDLSLILERDYPTDLTFFLKQVYQNEFAGRFLASLAGKINHLQDHPYVLDIEREAIELFFRHHISRYDKNGIPIGFVGSIALNMKDLLIKYCQERGYVVTSVVSNPLDGIQEYLREELYPS